MNKCTTVVFTLREAKEWQEQPHLSGTARGDCGASLLTLFTPIHNCPLFSFEAFPGVGYLSIADV